MSVTINPRDFDSYPNDSYPEITEIIWEGGVLIEGFFEKFPNLKKLNLSDNQISDLSLLAGLVQLKELYLSENQISDLSPLTGLLQLKKLYLSENQISDLSPLTGLLQLKELNLYHNQISDLRPLAELLQLETLYLYENQISDLSPLIGLAQLKKLDLGENQISDLSPLTGLLQLKTLYLSENQISDMGPLSGLLQLKELDVHINRISDLGPLAELSQLIFLDLSGNQISKLGPLAELLQLKTLDVRNNRISELSPLVYLRNLEYLDYHGNILDIQTIQTARFLQRFEIGPSSKNSIYDDGQNVHNTHIQESICKSLLSLLKDPQPEFSLQKIVDNKLLPDKTKSLLVEYCEEKSIHSVHLITFEELLGYVWSRIENSSSSEDLFKILSEQIEDAECKCFTGRFNRVLSVLVGFYDDIVINISDNDRIGGIISIIGENIIPYNSEEHRNRSRERLLEEGYPPEIIEEWLSYIED